MKWKRIEFAPKDGSVVLVNDNTCCVPWTAAVWIECEGRGGWSYYDETLQDAYPLGPNPTHFIEVPPIPIRNRKVKYP